MSTFATRASPLLLWSEVFEPVVHIYVCTANEGMVEHLTWVPTATPENMGSCMSCVHASTI